MGLFGKRPSSHNEQTLSMKYLASAPPGTRVDGLAASCTLTLCDVPALSSSEVDGNVVTAVELHLAEEVVRGIMASDRDLSALVTRKSLRHLMFMVNGMEGAFGTNLDAAFASVGLREPPDCGVREPVAGLDPALAEGASAVGRTAFGISRAIELQDKSSAEWVIYARLYTDTSTDEMEKLAYTLTGWSAIVQARLINSGRVVTGRVPFLDPAYRAAPPLDEAGWYPNPPNHGGIVLGDAQFQRYWDGSRWSDAVRIREGRGWTERTLSLHSEPSD